ncbi:MAG: metallophosphoesterase [Bacteroidota bacterium]
MAYTIAHVTDIHIHEMEEIGLSVKPERQWQIILDDLKARGIDEFIFGGDIGAASALPWFFASISPFQVHLVLGNHDRFSTVKPFLPTQQGVLTGTLDYSYHSRGYHWIFMDSSLGYLNEAQVNWLGEELDSPDPVILTVHHPIFPVDTEQDRRFPLKNREPLQVLLKQAAKPVTLLCGHYHCASDTISGQIRQLLTPAASYQIEHHPSEIKINENGFYYRLLTLEDSGLHTELIWKESPDMN